MMTLLRCRYYTGWTLAQMGVTAAGLSYNGYDSNGKSKWDRIITVMPQLDFTHHFKDKIDMWNMSVQIWLKRYVYFRI